MKEPGSRLDSKPGRLTSAGCTLIVLNSKQSLSISSEHSNTYHTNFTHSLSIQVYTHTCTRTCTCTCTEQHTFMKSASRESMPALLCCSSEVGPVERTHLHTKRTLITQHVKQCALNRTTLSGFLGHYLSTYGTHTCISARCDA